MIGTLFGLWQERLELYPFRLTPKCEFVRGRLLAKKDIEVIVEKGSTSLFKNGESSARLMRLFLSGDESTVLESERAQTIDVMRYVLSYVYDSLSIPDGIKHEDTKLMEASIRSLLTEFVTLSRPIQGSKFTESTLGQDPVSFEQFSRPPGQNIEMKRGDWICPKCSFMNFARNSRCLECEEVRPKMQLTGAEWECPQCEFFNYGRNMSCLRCDCKRPAEIPSTAPYGKSSSVDQILGRGNTDKADLEQRLAANDEKAERWFNKVSQLGDKADINSADEDFPEIMPLRKGVNRFVVSTRKTPLERRLANSPQSDTPSESSINESLDRILGRTSTPPAAEEANYRQSSAKTDPGYVPFVPLPPNTFSKPKSSNNEDSSSASPTGSNNYNESSDVPDDDFPEIMPMRKGENRFVVSKKKDRSLTSPQYKRRLAMEQANKSDFVPFVPFPPGYFAKKDKQPEATAPSNIEAIPLNPAPSEKAQAVPEKSDNTSQQPETRSYSQSYNASQQPESRDYSQNYNTSQQPETRAYGQNYSTSQQPATRSYSQSYNTSQQPENRGYSQSYNNPQQSETKGYDHSYNTKQPENRGYGQSYNSSQQTKSKDYSQSYNSSKQTESKGYDQSYNISQQTESTGYSQSYNSKQTETKGYSQNYNSRFSGKSLEGSAVTEPDPLDMSEEAKAARWFRRAAQIKNISELSEIPDEDFPEIMPMRKGVNRFVVSKRKTPLERRLTSPQYRRNLPIVRSEPEKDAS
ncbi:uncharacterized protein A4U43_C08F32790 [Asparagus officinalis]|nr:uncharacterized protein A4U43_C08F32790 [Asparagus officinalis]